MSLAILREDVISQLNAFVAPIMKRIGFKAAINVTGLSTAEELEEKMTNLVDGTMSFKEVYNTIYVL